MNEAADAAAPADVTAARRVNELAWRWKLPRGTKADDGLTLSFGDDRELVDAADGPFGNKGGLYIESRIRISPCADGGGVLRVVSPTITTPLAGVPEPFLASHYMKTLCPRLVSANFDECVH